MKQEIKDGSKVILDIISKGVAQVITKVKKDQLTQSEPSSGLQGFIEAGNKNLDNLFSDNSFENNKKNDRGML